MRPAPPRLRWSPPGPRSSAGQLLRAGVGTCCGLISCLLLAARPALPAEDGWTEATSRLAAAWNDRKLGAYLALFDAATPAALSAERQDVAPFFESDACRFDLQRSASAGGGGARTIDALCFCVREPVGWLTYLRFQMEHRRSRWRVVARESRGEVSGLIHLELGEVGSRADGRRLRFEDFELEMRHGFLFPTVEEGGPNALVFVGDGRVHFRPRLPGERQQLRLYCGHEELSEDVHRALIRIHPADLERVLSPPDLEPDPRAARRLRRARQVLERHAETAYAIDGGLPRAPWWTQSPRGGAVVIFETRRGPLTYAVTSQPESISLFDRERQVQIALYPAADQPAEYSEDVANDVDVRHHDLRLTVDPSREWVEAVDRLRLHLLSPRATIRLRLDGQLTVHSVTSAAGTPQAHFRVGGQNLLLVSLDPELRAQPEVDLTVRYSGRLLPAARGEEEPPGDVERALEQQVIQRAPKVYSKDPPWYPRAEFVDYATYRLEVTVPEGYQAVSGGERRLLGHDAAGDRLEYVQRMPSRYVTLVVGKLGEAGIREGRAALLRGFGTAETRDRVPALLERAARILEYLEPLFGPLPYPTLNVVQTEGLTPGGHSPPGIVILSRRSLALRRALREDPAGFSDVPDFFLAHELAHQWWGHGVAPANYRERWLSEGFAHYAAALWVEHSAGEEPFRQVLARMARWAMAESDQGPVGLGRRVGHVTRNPRAYRAVVYDKGALVAHMLRRLTGDAAFFSALRELQAGRRFTTATTGDLQRALERASGIDLAPFLELWIRGTTIPRLTWDRAIEGNDERGYVTRLALGSTGLPGPAWIEVTLELAEGKRRMRVQVPPDGGTFTLPTATRPRKVSINEDWAILARVHRHSGLLD